MKLHDLHVLLAVAQAGSMSKAANLLIGGWAVAGITTLNTGFYGSTTVPAANCNSSFANPCRADVIANPYAGGSGRGQNGVDSPKFLVSAFDWPQNPIHARQNPRYGSAAANILLGNGINNWDLSLLKHFNVTERVYFEFRWETFNSFNHPSFSSPAFGPTAANFGRTTSTQTDPRVNQLGLKLYF